MRGIVTIDAGTTSIRASVFDERGRILAAEQRENPPTFHSDGRVEQSASSWESALIQVLSACAEAARSGELELLGLALTSQRSSVIPVDEAGEALHPAIMWQDLRTAPICRELEPSMHLVYNRTGLRISPVFSAVKMTWLRRHRGDIWARTHKMLGIHDFLLHRLTGDFVTDRSLASRTNLYDLVGGRWDPELMGLFEVEERQLCRLVDQGAIAGFLSPEAARATGLRAGLPVVSAGGDQQCAALGMGLLAPGRLVANTGTGSYIIGLADQPRFDPEMRLSCNVAASPGHFIVEAGILSSGALYAWFRDRFYGPAAPEGGRGGADAPSSPCSVGFEAVNAEAATSPPGARGLVLLPHFKGAGSPHWNPNATGLFFGLSLGTSRGDMARAVLEGIAAEMAQNVRLIEDLTGQAPEIRVSGGLTASPLYNQIQADMYGRRVIRSGGGEATARGAWISAAVRLGLYGNYGAAFAAAQEAQDQGGAAAKAAGEFLPEPRTAELYAALRHRAGRLYDVLESGGLYAPGGQDLTSG